MAILEFMTDEPVYQIIMIIVGIIGVTLGIDRTIESDEEESSILQFIGPIGALVIFAVLVLSIENDAGYTKYTLVFMIFFGLSLIAKPFRKLPIAFVISSVIGLALFYFVYTESDQDDEIFSAIPLKWLIAAIIGIILLVFIISFVQEQAMDIMLWLIGWGPLVTAFSAIIIVQGITLWAELPDEDGILGYLPG